ncbi:hypothetical protein [Leptothoe spongobia]|uniref:Uncharacterized protein n=1 Tax=Leptothoe spongobia TAU-MAC 1115 TaxID=1967444 RepID=A0A947DFV8_9CYAN|nr:hypothetical protein [Leptothoe spongobia]MBT9316307.1 hypothetical protein [Leptothoe spongobia TAU-MAC 1115]
MQLALALDGDVKPRPVTQSLTQRQAFESLLAELREEANLILKAAIALTGTQYESLTKVPTPLLKQAREAVFGESQQIVMRTVSVFARLYS